jgi:hypothetical protein
VTEVQLCLSQAASYSGIALLLFKLRQGTELCQKPWLCCLQVFHCADAFATIVVVDSVEGRPSHIPFELQPATEEEKLRLEVSQLHWLAYQLLDAVWLCPTPGRHWPKQCYYFADQCLHRGGGRVCGVFIPSA